MYNYLSQPLERLLAGEPNAPLVIKCSDNKVVGREIIIRIKINEVSAIWEITTAHELPNQLRLGGKFDGHS